MAGLPVHDEPTAMNCLAEIGYGTLALVPRRTSLNHDHPAWKNLIEALSRNSERDAMRLVLDLDGLFMADPHARAWPSLASSDVKEGDLAVSLGKRWIQSAKELGVSLITITSGPAQPMGEMTSGPAQPMGAARATDDPRLSVHRGRVQTNEAAWDRLGPRISELLQTAHQCDATLAIRPAAGNAVATTAHYETMLQWIESEVPLHLAADVDAMIQGGEFPMAPRLVRHLPSLQCLFLQTSHLIHETQGEFHLDVGRLWRTLEDAGFEGPTILRSKFRAPSSGGPPGLDDAERAWQAWKTATSVDHS